MKIFIGIPSDKGWIRANAAKSYAANLLYLEQMGMYVNGDIVSGECASNARAIIVEQAREWGADWIGMMDDDMVVNPDVFHKLIQRNVDVIIPTTTSRKPPFDPVIYDLVPADEPNGRFKNKYVPRFTLKRGLNKADGVGSGVILFKANIFDQIMRPWFWTFPVQENEYGKIDRATGEDLFFSTRARNFGFDLYYDGDLQVGHEGVPIMATPSLSIQIGTIKMEDVNVA